MSDATPRPRFSIVMSIYNQESWLERSIESLLAQDIGFKDNVELVLVNDGSHDASLEICERYRDLYPNNIQVVSQENSGLSASRNAGMQLASGELINFMDPDDLLEPRTLSSVHQFAKDHDAEQLAVFSIPLEFIGSKTGLHPKYDSMPTHSAVIDLGDTPHAFLLTAAASFYPREIILKYRFNSANIAAEDSELNLLLQCEHGFRWGYVCEPDSKYLYWQHEASKSMIGANRSRRDPAESIMRFLLELLNRSSPVHPAIRSATVYLLRPRILEMRASWFTSPEDYSDFRGRLATILSVVTAEELAESPWIQDRPTHFSFSEFSTLSSSPWSLVQDSLIADRGAFLFPAAELPVRVNRVNLRPTSVEVEAAFYDYRVSGLDLVLVSSTGDTIEASESSTLETALSPKNNMGPISNTCYRRFVIPVPSLEGKWFFAFRDAQTSTLVRATDVQHRGRSPFTGNDASTKAASTDYWVRFSTEQEFWVRRAKNNPWLYNLRSSIRLAVRRQKLIPARLFASPDKRVLLINDRPMFGDDNGEALFRYIQENRPDLAKDTWFVLAKSALSYPELKKTKRVVTPQSFKHKRLFLNTKILFSSHLAQVFNSPWEGREHSACADVIDQTFVWLQHGVTMNAVDRAFTRTASDVDGLVVATHHETDYALRPEFLHSDASVLGSGFPRFDRLVDSSKTQSVRSLLVAPTWRTWLTGRILADGTHEAVEDFESSDYFAAHRALLTSPDVLKSLEETNSNIEFLLHPGMSVYAEKYLGFASPRVKIHLPGSVRYQDAFNRSSAMITDYSSIFFDFAYLRKPVLFDHSDIDQFRESHYQEGVFDYEKDAPGPTFSSVESLIAATTDLIRGGFTMDDEYNARLDRVFLHTDRSNSSRVIEAALKVDSDRRGSIAA